MTHQVTATGARRGHCVRDAHTISDCNERDGRQTPLVYAEFTAPILTNSLKTCRAYSRRKRAATMARSARLNYSRKSAS
jgi:hypothetical protein